MGFGPSLLENVDPNPENFVCVGIIHTKAMQIGCLMRIEPNRQAQVCLICVGPKRKWKGGFHSGVINVFEDRIKCIK